MKKRIEIVDLWRFIIAIIVMLHHTYLFHDYNGVKYPLYAPVYYVDILFLLTGYFTYLHFSNRHYDNVPKACFEYTVRKFAVLLPYSTLALLVQYIIDSSKHWGVSLRSVIASFYEMPFDMLYLRESYTNVSRIVPLWFISAMFLTFPVILLIVQIKNKYTIAFITFLYPVFYYNYTGMSAIRDWPHDLLRAIAGMCLGIFVCALLSIIEDYRAEQDDKCSVLLTLIEIATLLYPIVASIFVWGGTNKLCLLSLVIGFTIMLSGRSYTSKLHIPGCNFLQKISMPLYIWQWTVGSLILKFAYNLPFATKLVFYFAGTLIVSLVTMGLVNLYKKIRTK